MTKHYVGEEVTLSTTITENDEEIDPTTVTFEYRIGRDNSLKSVQPTKINEGDYDVVIILDKPGMFYGTWKTTGTPTVASPVVFPVFPADGIRG